MPTMMHDTHAAELEAGSAHAQAGAAVSPGAALPLPEIRLLAGGVGQLLLPPGMAQAGARRLVALVPDAEIDEAGWAARLWRLAAPRGLPLLLVGVAQRPEEQYRTRRRLINLAAITRADNVPVDMELLVEIGWEAAARRFWKPGDLLVCPSELQVSGLLGPRALAQTLVRRLGAPVFVFSGLSPSRPGRDQGLARQLLSWMPPAAILIGFFWVQAQLAQATAGPLQTVALICTVVIEFALIAWWEHLNQNL